MADLFSLMGKISVDYSDAMKGIDDISKSADGAADKMNKVGKSADASKDPIDGAGEAAGKADGKFSTWKMTLANLYSVGIQKVIGGVVSLGKKLGELTVKSVQAYSEYEQLVGGVETLFKDSGDKLIEYANGAYETAGMSANEYMETATSFAASLIQGLGGDTEAAVRLTDQAITDMSDNANKMGTDIGMIQNAYQGFAKQNYTMLDNLKLGYGGTQEEMIRLINDSGILSEKIESMDGISFDQVIEAIHKVQDNLGITGTTAKEAASTIQGSIGMMKGAWENFLTGMADPDQDFDALLGNLVDSVVTVADNLVPRIMMVLPRLVDGVSRLCQSLAGYLPGIIKKLLPALLSAILALLNEITTILPALIEIILDFLPTLIDGVFQLINGLVAALPALIQMICDALPTLIVQIVQSLVANLPALIQGLIQLMLALVTNLPIIIQSLIDALPTVIQLIIQALVSNLPMLINGCIQLVLGLVQAIPTIIVSLIEAIPTIITTIIQGFAPLGENLTGLAMTVMDGVKNVFVNAWNGIKDIITAVMENIGTVISTIWEAIKATVSTVLETIKAVISRVFNAIKDTVTNILNSVKSVFSNIWNGIKNTVTTVVNAIKTAITKPIQAAKDTISNTLNAVKNTFTNVFNKIKSFLSPVVNWIKGIFDFEWSLPKIKLPHFSITGEFSLAPPSIPHFNIEWYKKAMDDGMIMNQPTIFGFNQKSNQFLAGGEAGSETVVGTGSLMTMIKTAVAEENSELMVRFDHLISILLQFFPQILSGLDREIILDSGTLVGSLAPGMDAELGNIYKKRKRGVLG